MYLQVIDGILQNHNVKIKYDCAGGFEKCGQEVMLKLKYAEKNYKDNGGKHICRQCQLRTKNPMKRKDVQDKVKKTCFEKYGTELPLNSEANIQKRREQFDDEQFKEQWLQKRKETALKKYGVEHHMKSDISKENQKKAMREKYGVDHPYQSPEIMAKMKANNLAKYGVENVAQLPEVQIKMAKATLERYGVEHYNQLPEMREYLKDNCTQWLAESYKNPWNKGIKRPEEWNAKQRETVAELIAKGEWDVGDKKSIKGRYISLKCLVNKPMFRSSYELITHIWLDENEEVEGYEYEPFIIPYYGTDGHKRYYFPDFLIKFRSKLNLFLLEVKNDYAMKAGININKDKAAREYCANNGLDYDLWSNSKIEELHIDYQDFEDRFVVFG